MILEKKNRYGLIGKLRAVAGQGKELASILLEASQVLSAAAGCHLYVVSQDAGDETLIWIQEVWDSRQEHDESLNLPGVRELIARAMPLLEGRPEPGTPLNVWGGKGLD